MNALSTKPSLLRALSRAAHSKAPGPELERQRISFIMSAVNKNGDVTEAKIKEVLAENEGAA